MLDKLKPKEQMQLKLKQIGFNTSSNIIKMYNKKLYMIDFNTVTIIDQHAKQKSQITLKQHKSQIIDLKFTENYIITCSNEKKICQFDTKFSFIKQFGGLFNAVCFDVVGEILIVGCQNQVMVYNVQKRDCVSNVQLQYQIKSIQFDYEYPKFAFIGTEVNFYIINVENLIRGELKVEFSYKFTCVKAVRAGSILSLISDNQVIQVDLSNNTVLNEVQFADNITYSDGDLIILANGESYYKQKYFLMQQGVKAANQQFVIDGCGEVWEYRLQE